MPARTTRAAARAHLRAQFEKELERLIPADEETPLRGRAFLDFEEQVEKLTQAVGRSALEQRAALDERAKVEEGGTCPFCGSESVYLERQETQPRVNSPDGPVEVPLQQARCRRCDGSFSPSGARLGFAPGSTADAARLAPRGTRSRHAEFRPSGPSPE